MLKGINYPLVFAHRGASVHAPENTLASFQRALDDGAPAIEFDVKLSADGQVVVIHDQTVDRTTDGHGKVRRLTLAQLRALDAGSWFDISFRGERIPTLEEVFAAFGQRLFMNVELTNYASPFDLLVPKVALLVKKFKVGDQVILSSFFPHNLSTARRVLPEVPRGLLAFTGVRGGIQLFIGRFMDLQSEHPFVGDVSARYISSVHGRRRKVFVYTVNDEAQMRVLLDRGADGIFTDDPALALTVLAAQ
jgi:glycerophosphoryl diester phosphodiesterase